MAGYADLYNTQLSPAEEKAFKQWTKANNREHDSEDYDMRGAWKAMQKGDVKQAANGHFPDTYKKPNHPTFSDESIYNGVDGHYGGKWLEDGKGTSFQMGPTQETLWHPEDLDTYFRTREPDVRLIRPQMLNQTSPQDSSIIQKMKEAIQSGGAVNRTNYE